MPSVELPEGVKSVEVLRLEPGDWLIVTHREWISPQMKKVYKQVFEEITGSTRVLVFDGGLGLTVIRGREFNATPPTDPQPV